MGGLGHGRDDRRCVAIGASAGGVGALQELVAALPEDLGGAIIVVLHVPATAPSRLPEILGRAGVLSAEPIGTAPATMRPGHLYVAPPDRHVVVEDGRVRAMDGPRRNGHRPAIDPLFESLAALGSDAMGILLSGTLDDGVVGMEAIHAAGGATLVQDPDQALYPQLPRHAIERVRVDAVLPLAGIAARVTEFLATPPEHAPAPASMRDPAASLGAPAGLSCPECGGSLFEVVDGHGELACRAGHTWSPASFLGAQADSVERALWTAHTMIAERVALKRRLAREADAGGRDVSARFFSRNADALEAEARTVEALIDRLAATGTRVVEAP